MSRARDAPSATRTAISRRRALARASMTVATFAQATTSTSATMMPSRASTIHVSPPAIESRSESAWALHTALEDDLRAKTGLSMNDYHVLVHLSEAPGRRLRMGELASALWFSPSRVTYQINSMVKRGLVHKQPCPEDGRGQEGLEQDRVEMGRQRSLKTRDERVDHQRRRRRRGRRQHSHRGPEPSGGSAARFRSLSLRIGHGHRIVGSAHSASARRMPDSDSCLAYECFKRLFISQELTKRRTVHHQGTK